MTGRRRRAATVLTAVACAAAVSTAAAGCQFTGLGSLPLPFTPGTGPGTYTVTAQVSDVGNLPPNSEVMVRDITVGTVTAIRFSDWHADVTISLPDRVKLPANATAAIGQKSLLGAEYLALAPPVNARPAGQLANGDVIPLSATSTYPSTEEVLAALSTVLNGGGLNQLSTITRELNAALRGHTSRIRSLLGSLATLMNTLNSQRASIVAALASMNRLTASIKAQDATLASALGTVPSGLAVVNRDQGKLATALRDTTALSGAADRVINGSRQNLVANLRDLQPPLARLADSGQTLFSALKVLPTFPFPVSTVLRDFKGDYSNLFLTLDLTVPELTKVWLTGLPPSGLSPGNPLTSPLRLPAANSPAGPRSRSGGSGGSGGCGAAGGTVGGILGGLTGGGC